MNVTLGMEFGRIAIIIHRLFSPFLSSGKTNLIDMMYIFSE